MADPLLTVTDAQKAYGSHPALRGVTFDLNRSERLALLGPNGAGKTTLIRAICGRLGLDFGSIRLGGRLMKRGADRHTLGMVPQEVAVYGDLSAEQNLSVFGRLHGVRGRQLAQRIDEALHWTRLESRRHDLVQQLSGGMQRRLNIACGVLHKPQILLLDEPTVGVDPQSRELIFEMLNDLRKRETSILLTTHLLGEAESHCDRVVIIDHGQVIASGTVEELIRQTVGKAQKLSVRFAGAKDGVVSSPDLSGFSRDIPDVVSELPGTLAELQQHGGKIEQLTLRAPTLQDVFLHLTGRELRE